MCISLSSFECRQSRGDLTHCLLEGDEEITQVVQVNIDGIVQTFEHVTLPETLHVTEIPLRHLLELLFHPVHGPDDPVCFPQGYIASEKSHGNKSYQG